MRTAALRAQRPEGGTLSRPGPGPAAPSRPEVNGMGQPTAGARANRVEALSSLRFVSALAILTYHLFPGDKPPLRDVHPVLAHAVESLFVATSFFFVLSGFVLTIAYDRQAQNGTFHSRDFLFRRLTRLYPAYLVGLVAIVVTFAIYPVPALQGDPHLLGWDFASKALMIHSWIPRFTYTWNYPSWAVSVVVFFYVVFAFGFRWFARLPLRRAVGLAALAYAVSIVVVLVFVLLSPHGRDAVAVDDFTPWTIRMKCWPLFRLPEFVIGAAAGRIYLARDALGLDARLGKRLVIGGVVVSVVGLILSSWVPYLIMHNLALVLPFAGTILGIALAHRSRGLKFLASPRLVRLGDATYSVLILQASFIVVLYETGVGEWGHPAVAIGVRALTIALCVVAALVSRNVFELPAIRWVDARNSGLVSWFRRPARAGVPVNPPGRAAAGSGEGPRKAAND
jgi:peptidoglycan/LPS O-acetylase OafA/YrhL